MTVDFFDQKYQTENPRGEAELGIVDSNANTKQPAYTTLENKKSWMAIVENTTGKMLQFVPIDYNIPLRNNDGTEAKRCDGMLYFISNNNMICFVELKTGKNPRNWLSIAIEQLKNTINCFYESGITTRFDIRLAYVANGLHPKVNGFSLTRQQQFKDETNFHLKIEHIIRFAGLV